MKYHKTTFFERSAGSTKYLKVFTHQSKTFACYDSEAPCFHRVQLIRFSFFEEEKNLKVLMNEDLAHSFEFFVILI